MINLDIIKIASDTENHGVIEKCTHHSKSKNPICGDEMKIYLLINANKILNFKYQCQSCIYCQASVSLLSKKLINKTVNEVKDFLENADKLFGPEKIKINEKWKDFEKIINKKNVSRKECLLLPIKTTLKALNN